MGFDNDSGVQFGDADGLRNFFLNHQLAHRAYAGAIVNTYKVSVPGMNFYDTQALEAWIRCMDDDEAPIPPPLQSWLEQHDQIHQSELALLGQSGTYDFSSLDPRNPGQFYDWMMNHQNIHDFEATQFGVTI